MPFLPAPLPPDTTATAPAPPVVGGVISIGVDANIRGFNPYVTAQYSPAGTAISALVLPSVFAPGSAEPGDPPTALIAGITVNATGPFTVTYELNRSAAWSDGTPIAAEDFSYLWTQMANNTGVVSPGGYQLISSIQSLNAGKTVVVQFKTPYADWRTLFSPLLPARTLKDEPGGFAAALQTGIPVAGSRYRLDSYDPVIGQVKLARNDKYWAQDTTANTVVLREGSAADLVESLRRGDLQALYLQASGPAAGTLAALGSTVRLTEVPLAATENLVFNTSTTRTGAQPAVRQGVAAALNTTAVRLALTANNSAGALAPVSRLTLAADPNGTTTAQPAGITDDAPASAITLVHAGFKRDGLYFRRNGQVLTLTLGYLLGDDRARTTARQIQQQLGGAGILLNLVALADPDLFAALTATSPADIVLTTRPRGPSDRAGAVAAFDCGTAFDAAPKISTSTTTATSTSTGPTTAADSRCTGQVKAAVAGYLDGTTDGTRLDRLLWDQLDVLPLAEPVATLALGPALASVRLPDDRAALLWGGPLRSLPEWAPPG